jgi:hypothetical protein
MSPAASFDASLSQRLRIIASYGPSRTSSHSSAYCHSIESHMTSLAVSTKFLHERSKFHYETMKSTLQVPKHVSRCSKLETDATHTKRDRTVPTSGSLSSGVRAAFDVHSQPVGPFRALPLVRKTEILCIWKELVILSA